MVATAFVRFKILVCAFCREEANNKPGKEDNAAQEEHEKQEEKEKQEENDGENDGKNDGAIFESSDDASDNNGNDSDDDSDFPAPEENREDSEEELEPYKSKHSPFAQKHVEDKNTEFVAYTDLHQHFRPRATLRVGSWAAVKSACVLHACNYTFALYIMCMCVSCNAHATQVRVKSGRYQRLPSRETKPKK